MPLVRPPDRSYCLLLRKALRHGSWPSVQVIVPFNPSCALAFVALPSRLSYP